MEKDYYKWYYEVERKHWWFEVRNEIIIDLIRKAAGGKKLKILNVGVATGHTTELLMEFGEVTSVEYDKDCFNYLQTFLPGELVNGSITELPFGDNEFDLVCAFDVVEHVEQDQFAVDELSRVCKANGHIVISVPAFKFLWSEHDIINHHIKRYTRKEIEGLLSKNKIGYVSYFNFILFIPIAAVRVTKTLIFGTPKAEDAKSDFKSVKPTTVSRMLKALFSSEKWFINRGVELPFGVSILAAAQKRTNE